MNNNLDIGRVHIRLVENGTDGLLAWASCVISDSIRLENLAVRRGKDKSLYLTYPRKTGAGGTKHSIFYPISAQAAEAIQDAVLARLASLAKAAAAGGVEG